MFEESRTVAFQSYSHLIETSTVVGYSNLGENNLSLGATTTKIRKNNMSRASN